VLDENNRWDKLSKCIPWDELTEGYYPGLSDTQGRPTKDARLVIGAVMIKHKLCLSDRETVAQIQENLYLPYFVGLAGYRREAPFAPSLFVEIRKRMGQSVFDVFQGAFIDAVENARPQQKTMTDGRDVYPEVVLGDPIYGTRANRRYLKGLGIRFAGNPLGRSKKVTQENREALREEQATRREEYLQRIPIAGKFGQGKNGYRLNYIRAKRADTSVAWINSIFLVMNLLILLRVFFALCKTGVLLPSLAFAWIKEAHSYPWKAR
jgi:Transposase DDE domain/Transposase domain (DUF772)